MKNLCKKLYNTIKLITTLSCKTINVINMFYGFLLLIESRSSLLTIEKKYKT